MNSTTPMALALGLLTLYGTLAVGQQSLELAKQTETLSLEVYALKFVDAKVAGETARAFFGGAENKTIRIEVDERTNRLLVMGSPESHANLKKLLSELDRPVENREALEVVILQDSNDVEIAEVVNLVPDAKVAMTKTARGVLLRGTAKDIERIRAVLRVVENVSSNSATQESRMLVELLWLTESTGLSAKPAEPALAGKLKTLGFENLHVLNAMEIRAGSRGKLLARTTNPDFEVSVSGDTEVLDQGIQLQLRIEAAALRTGGSKQEATRIDVSSEIVTKIDHWIIFGVAHRDSPSASEAGRDLILVRVKEAAEL